MGLLDQILGGLMGGSASASPLQNVLMNMLAGGQQGQPQGQGGGLGGLGQGMAGGGLSGLIGAFEQAGLGQVAQSWVGNGENQPVSPQQLESVLGGDQVQAMANQAGMGTSDFLTQLSQHLPNVVNSLTPNGRVPDEGTMSV